MKVTQPMSVSEVLDTIRASHADSVQDRSHLRRPRPLLALVHGTLVIEASTKSAAKMQAWAALEHAKKVFLVKSLINRQPWTTTYVERGAIVVDRVEDILAHVTPPEKVIAAAEQRLELARATLDLA